MLSYFDFTPEPEDRDKDQDGARRPCAVCKAVHIACDRGRPCARCLRLGKEHLCQDPPLQRRGRKPLILRSVHKHKDEEVKTSPYGATQRPSAMADSQGRIIATSPEFLQLLGFTSHEELLGLECQILPGGPNQLDFTGLLRGDMLSLLQAGGSEQERDVVVDTLWMNSRHEPMVLSTQVISYIRDGALICSRLNILRVRPTSTSSSGVPHVSSTGSLSSGLSNSSSEPNSPGSTSSVNSAPGSPRQAHSGSASPARFLTASPGSLAPPGMTRPRSHSSPNPPPVPFVLSGGSMPQLSLRVSNPGSISVAAAAASAPPSPQTHHHQHHNYLRQTQPSQQQHFPQHFTAPQGVFPFAVPLVDNISPRPPSPHTSTASSNVPAISISLYPTSSTQSHSHMPRHHSNPTVLSVHDMAAMHASMMMSAVPQPQSPLHEQYPQHQHQIPIQFATTVPSITINSSADWLSQASHSSGASSDHSPSDDFTASLGEDTLAGQAAEEFASSLLIWDETPQQLQQL